MGRNGLLVMRGPSEVGLSVSPKNGDHGQASRRLGPAPNSTIVLSAVQARPYLDPVADGRRSGFQCSIFPRRPSAIGSSAHVPRGNIAVVIFVVALVGRAL